MADAVVSALHPQHAQKTVERAERARERERKGADTAQMERPWRTSCSGPPAEPLCCIYAAHGCMLLPCFRRLWRSESVLDLVYAGDPDPLHRHLPLVRTTAHAPARMSGLSFSPSFLRTSLPLRRFPSFLPVVLGSASLTHAPALPPRYCTRITLPSCPSLIATHTYTHTASFYLRRYTVQGRRHAPVAHTR